MSFRFGDESPLNVRDPSENGLSHLSTIGIIIPPIARYELGLRRSGNEEPLESISVLFITPATTSYEIMRRAIRYMRMAGAGLTPP